MLHETGALPHTRYCSDMGNATARSWLDAMFDKLDCNLHSTGQSCKRIPWFTVKASSAVPVVHPGSLQTQQGLAALRGHHVVDIVQRQAHSIGCAGPMSMSKVLEQGSKAFHFWYQRIAQNN